MNAREPSPAGVCASDNGGNIYYVKLALLAFYAFLTFIAVTGAHSSAGVSIHPLTTCPRWKEAPAMPSSPLRLITFRRLQVFTHYRGFPRLFTVVESLGCGHTSISHTWEFLDLVNAYTTNTDVSARRRRCHACARLLSPAIESGVQHGRETEVYRDAPADHRRDNSSRAAAPVGRL